MITINIFYLINSNSWNSDFCPIRIIYLYSYIWI